uniref:Uncharacterized protein n=1 Tax=Anopheles atroparvus TaxID=41427 RepID=A0A182JK07_ANOAO
MSSSPEMQHHHQQQQEGGAPLSVDLKSGTADGTPSPELATMTNVSVLDLHKEYNGGAGGGDSAGDGGGGGGGAGGGGGVSVTSPHIGHDGATDMSLPDDGTTEKVYDKETNTVHIQRLLGNQEIISRDIINGEHHIITRNENGETILTRIAISTADQLLSRMDNNIIYTTTTAGGGGAAPASHPDQLPTTVMQYEKEVEEKPHHGHQHQQLSPHAQHQPQTMYTTAAPAASETATSQAKPIVYTIGGGEPKNVIYGDPKAAMPHFEAAGGGGGSGGNGGPGSVDTEKPQIDYVYNEGNKTVIYTDQKGLESLYANNELGLMDGTQIVVQGNLQYTQQQGPDGTTVYVVSSDMNPDDMTGLQSRNALRMGVTLPAVCRLHPTISCQELAQNGLTQGKLPAASSSSSQ